MLNRFKFPCNYNNPIQTEKIYTMKRSDSNFVAQCLLVTAVLLSIAWYVLSVSGLHVTRFFSESVNFYGIIAFVLALYSLWYTYQSYVSQRRTEINTENVPVDELLQEEDLQVIRVSDEYDLIVGNKIKYYSNGALVNDTTIKTSKDGVTIVAY